MDIHIANGRVGKDRYIGRPACRNTSRVDYCFFTSVFTYFRFFIDDFNVLLFDCHRTLSIKFCTQPNTSDISGFVQNGSNLSKTSKWKSGHSSRFCSNIDEYKLELIQTELEKEYF